MEWRFKDMARPKLREDKINEAMGYVREGMTVKDAAAKVGISRQSMYNYGVKHQRKAVAPW